MAELTAIPSESDWEGIQEWLPRYIEDPQAVPYAYRRWIGHLARLDQQAAVSPLELNWAEREGLALLRAAREKYSAEHTACPQCGAMIDRLTAAAGMSCKCGYRFEGDRRP